MDVLSTDREIAMLMLALLLQTASVAAAPANSKPAVAKADPNRLICVTEEITGSRLGSQKRCLTAAQWDDHRRDERMTMDHYQRLARPDGGG